MRAGHRNGIGRFIPVPNGGVLHTHFIDPAYTEQRVVAEGIQGRACRVNLLGDGCVEAIGDSTLLETAAEQRKVTAGKISGKVVYAPVIEAPGEVAVGRFGWKSRHASLLSSVSDALQH